MAFEKWLSALCDVNPSGEAPHKPLLLLTVLKAAERDEVLPEVLLLSPELVYQFKLFEHIVAHRRKQKLDIRMPFFHLKTSGVWTPLDKHGGTSEVAWVGMITVLSFPRSGKRRTEIQSYFGKKSTLLRANLTSRIAR